MLTESDLHRVDHLLLWLNKIVHDKLDDLNLVGVASELEAI